MTTNRNPSPSNTLSIAAIPHSQEAEEAVLGSIIIAPNSYFQIADELSPSDFFFVRHKCIFEAMGAVIASDRTLDYLLLQEELRTRGQLQEIGGGAYLSYLINKTPTSVHGLAYAKLVKRTALRRNMLGVADQFKAAALDEHKALEDIVAIANKLVADYVPDPNPHMVTMKEALSDHMNMVEKATAGEGKVGIPSWNPDLTNIIEGYERGKLYIVAGRPGQGKTSFALREIQNMAGSLGVRVGLFTLEMDRGQIINNLVAMEAQLPGRLMQRGLRRPDDMSRYTEVVGRMANWKLFIDDSSGITAEDLKIKALRMHRQYGIQALFIDYMQLMEGSAKYAGNRVQEVAHISRVCKGLAKDLNIPVIALAQLNRDVERRGKSTRPTLADLKESGQIEQDADAVMFTWQPMRQDRPEDGLPEVVPTTFIVEKQREGEVDDIPMGFWGRYKKFIRPEQEINLLGIDHREREARRKYFSKQSTVLAQPGPVPTQSPLTVIAGRAAQGDTPDDIAANKYMQESW